MRRLGPWELLALGSVLLAALIRFQGLGWESLWGDEFATLGQASKPTLHDVIYDGFGGDPPLYQVLLHEWFKAFGSSDIAARTPAAVFGVACVVAVYFAGRSLVGSQLGAVAALILAVMPYHIWYSQQVRSYSLFSIAGLGTFYFLQRATTRNRGADWVWLGAAAALLIHVHYIGFLLLGTALPVVAAALVRREHTGQAASPPALWHALLALLVFAALCAPLSRHLSVLLGLVSSGVGLSDHPTRWGQVPSVKDLLHPLVGVFFSNTPLSDKAAALPAAVLLALFGFGLLQSKRLGLLCSLASCTVAPVAVLGVMGTIWACWLPRFFQMITPMVALTMAIGIVWLPRRWVRAVALAVLLGASGLSIANMKLTHCRIQARTAAEYIAAHSATHPLIISNEVTGLVKRYYPQPERAHFVAIGRGHWDQASRLFAPGVAAMIEQALPGHTEAWVVTPTRMESSPVLEAWVAAQPWVTRKLDEKDFFEIRAVAFQVRPEEGGLSSPRP